MRDAESMNIPFYQIDAFTSRVFAGNPAGVCFLEQWLEDRVLQSIAEENNLSETAFLVNMDGANELRWFTPKVEVNLCGHATLAAAFAVFESVNPQASRVSFRTKSGTLSVERQGELLVMDFPARPLSPLRRRRILTLSLVFGLLRSLSRETYSSSTRKRSRSDRWRLISRPSPHSIISV